MIKQLFTSVAESYYEYVWKTERSVCYMTVYLIGMLAALFMTSFGIRISLSIRVYHPNITRIYCSALAIWVTLFISKSSAFLFQIRGYNNNSKTVDRETSGLLLLQIAAFTRYFYYFFGSATPLAATVERGFATIFLADYEKRSRLPVAIGIIATNAVLGVVFASSAVFFELQLLPLVIIPFSNVIICFVLLNILYRYNIRRIRRLNKYHRDTQYTLSKRYQLRENIRILTLLMRMIYSALLFIALIVVGLTLPVFFKVDSFIVDWLKTFTEFVFNCNPLLVIPMTAFFIPEFKRKARAALFRSVQLARSSVDSSNRSAYYKKTNEADVYFDQFKKSMTRTKDEQKEYPVAFIRRYT